MKKTFLASMAVITAAFFTACEPAANTSNKAANSPANNAASTPAVYSAAIESEIKKLVNDQAAALAKNDADALDKLYSDNYMLVNLDGSIQSKVERLASIRSGDTKFESFVYDEVNVRTNPEGTGAIAIARATAKGMNKGTPIPAGGYVRVTQVLSKTKDGWRVVSGHATNITGDSASSPAAANTYSSASNTSTGSNTAVNK